MLLLGQAVAGGVGGGLGRLATPVLVKMLLTWRSTVLGLMNRAWAMARVLWPAAIRRRTSTSRPVSPAGQAGPAGAGQALRAGRWLARRSLRRCLHCHRRWNQTRQ